MNQNPAEPRFDDSGAPRRPGARDEPELRNEDDNIPHEPNGPPDDIDTVRPEEQSDG